MSSAPTAPAALGRGVIVAPGAAPPEAWSQAPRHRLDAAAIERPTELIAALHRAWSQRQPVVLELGLDPAELRDPEAIDRPPHAVSPDLELPRERLHHLLWANNYDAREGELTWWWAEKAIRAGAIRIEAAAGEPGDVELEDGRAVWVDGGPRWSCPELEQPVLHTSSLELGSLTPIETGSRLGAELAPDQLRAVRHRGGPLRVVAPAGSGKTRVLTERIRYLLEERGYERAALIAVAYNKEAQRELEARLFRQQPRTRTLNSLGYRIVAEHRGGRPPLLEEPEARRLIEQAFPIPRRRRANTDPVGPYLDALTLSRLGLRDPTRVEAERDDVPGFAEGFERYRALLAERGAVDFDEQVYAALEALLGDGSFRRRVQIHHRHLLVDEFQDLTPAHLLLIRLLAMPALDVFGVGDDDQTIYDHAGADPRFLVDYADYFPGAEATALEVNYRCAKPIVAGAARLLSYNRLRVEKRIRPRPEASEEESALELRSHAPGEAAEAIAELISEWRGEGTADAEIAVLARVNSLLMSPQIALWSAGVPLRSSVRPEVLERAGVAAALAWLRIAVDPDGLIPADLELVRRRPSRGFPGWISKWLVNCRSIADLRGAARALDDGRVADKLGAMADDAERLAEAARGGADARALLVLIRDRIGLGGAMEMLDDSKGAQRAASHLDDLEGLIQVSDLHPDPDSFEPWLRAALAESGGTEGVTLSTVHRVKGREWERVAVFGANAGILPHRLSEDWEAERRVLHVAITRARERSVVLSDRERPSPFLDEIRGTAERAATAPAAPTAGSGSRSRRPVAAVAPEAGSAEQALKRWRSERANADGVPAYVLLSNRQLEGVAAAMPSDARELLACEGIGPARLERYGEEILAILDSVRG